MQAGAYRTLLSAEEDEDSAHLVYLGLAAAAFLLLTLFPSGGADHVGGSPKTMTPLSSERPLHSGSPAARQCRCIVCQSVALCLPAITCFFCLTKLSVSGAR